MKFRITTLSSLAFAAAIGFAGAAWATDAKTFDEADTDKNGVLSQAEAAKVEKLDFAKADLNKDGMIDRAEYNQALS
jgi:hypothetical protein